MNFCQISFPAALLGNIDSLHLFYSLVNIVIDNYIIIPENLIDFILAFSKRLSRSALLSEPLRSSLFASSSREGGGDDKDIDSVRECLFQISCALSVDIENEIIAELEEVPHGFDARPVKVSEFFRPLGEFSVFTISLNFSSETKK